MGGTILAQEGYFMPHCTNNQAEYTALKLALIKAKELGAKELFIESDSLLLVKQFLGEYKIKNPDLQARMKIIRTLQTPFIIHIKHVLREFNKAPDALANKAMDAKQTLGFNPIKHLPVDEEICPPATRVNGVEVTPVVRTETKKAQPSAPKKPYQPSLFD
jgi:ribonuclease HI